MARGDLAFRLKYLVLALVFALPLSAQQVPAPQVPMSGRVGSGGSFPLLNAGTITMPTDADYTMVYPDTSAAVLKITSAVPLTATRRIIAPQVIGFQFSVENATSGGQNLVFGSSSGAAVTIPNGQAMLVMSDGTNYVSVGGGGDIGTVVFHGVSDAVKDTTCSTTANSPNLTCSDAPFSPCPTGKTISVSGGKLQSWVGSDSVARTLPNSLITTIQSCSGSTVAVMATNATNAISNTAARWGTDNGPAMLALANAPSTAGKTFVVPPGDYLVRTTDPVGPPDAATGNAIDVYPNTAYIFTKGSHIYWIGPLGCDGNDPACQYPGYALGEDGFRFMHLHDAGGNFNTDTWPPAHDVHIQIDGIIEGDATDAVPGAFWNNSCVIGWYGPGKFPTGEGNVHDINIDGTGALENILKFGIHGITGINTNVRHLTFKHIVSALNVNGWGVDQSFNYINGSVETTGANVTMIGNVFDDAPVSLGGTGSNTICSGYVFSGNVFHNMHSTNIMAAMCLVGAIISNNYFWVPSGQRADTAINFHDGGLDETEARENLIANNVFDGDPDCYAMVTSLGIYTGANVYSGNHVMAGCWAGYIFYNGLHTNGGTGPVKPEIVKDDNIISRTTYDVIVQFDDIVRLQGALLPTNTVVAFPNSSFTADSWFSKLNVGQIYNNGTRAVIQHKAVPVPPVKCNPQYVRVTEAFALKPDGHVKSQTPLQPGLTIIGVGCDFTKTKPTVPSGFSVMKVESPQLAFAQRTKTK